MESRLLRRKRMKRILSHTELRITWCSPKGSHQGWKEQVKEEEEDGEEEEEQGEDDKLVIVQVLFFLANKALNALVYILLL